jgi:hypothetical protein
MIKLAAVPFGNLGQAAGNLGGQGGGPVTINIYQQPGQDANSVANLAIQKLSTRVGARR